MRRLSKPKTNQEFVWNSWCLQYILVQQKTYFLCPLTEQDILDLVTRRLWDHDLIYVEVSVSGEGFTEAPSTAGSSDSGLVDVTFDREQKGPCWCQRGARHSNKPFSSSLSQHCYLSFNGLVSSFHNPGLHI